MKRPQRRLGHSWLFSAMSVLILTSLASADPIKVTVVQQGSVKWTDNELSLIQKSADTAFNRISTAKAVNCALRNTFRAKIRDVKGRVKIISKDQLRLMWEKQSGALNKSRAVTIEIDKSELGQKVLGRAEVGIAHTNPETYTLNNIKISMDQIKIADQLRKQTSAGDSDIWVNTIAHETAHTFSHLHDADPNQDWESNYAGFFPTELGFCVMTDGQFGSDMGKSDLLRSRKERFHFK